MRLLVRFMRIPTTHNWRKQTTRLAWMCMGKHKYQCAAHQQSIKQLTLVAVRETGPNPHAKNDVTSISVIDVLTKNYYTGLPVRLLTNLPALLNWTALCKTGDSGPRIIIANTTNCFELRTYCVQNTRSSEPLIYYLEKGNYYCK